MGELISRVLYPARLSFKKEREIKTLPDFKKTQIREFVTSRLALQEILKGILEAEMKGH